MTAAIALRAATAADAAAIAELTTVLAQRHIAPDCNARGLATVSDMMALARTAERLASADFRYAVAVAGDTLAGVIALRKRSHVYHLFVADAFQRQGIARRLLAFARDVLLAPDPPAAFTINASSVGVPAYARIGFVALSPPVEKDGIRSTPMRCEVALF